eukprot:1346022-Rhodomonas_salina.1
MRRDGGVELFDSGVVDVELLQVCAERDVLVDAPQRVAVHLPRTRTRAHTHTHARAHTQRKEEEDKGPQHSLPGHATRDTILLRAWSNRGARHEIVEQDTKSWGKTRNCDAAGHPPAVRE